MKLFCEAQDWQCQFLQKLCIDLAHNRHMGLVKTKELLREKVCFPFIDTLVEKKLKKVYTMFICFLAWPPEPVNVSELSTKPWEEVN